MLRERCAVCHIAAQDFDRFGNGFQVRVWVFMRVCACMCVCSSFKFQCFFCSVYAYTWKQAHLSYEHNLWNYLAFFVYLCRKKEQLQFQAVGDHAVPPLTSIETYVLNCFLSENSCAYFPAGESLTLRTLGSEGVKTADSELEVPSLSRLLCCLFVFVVSMFYFTCFVL